jgi:branched-chain amino acid transport system ATP-binding protein
MRLPNLGGAKVEVIYSDNQGNPSVGQNETLRLITQQNVAAMIGAYQSSVALTATAVAERYGIPFLVGDSVAPNITGRGFQWVFRTTPIAPDFSRTYMEFLDDMNKAGHTLHTIAIVNENTDYGTSVAEVLRKVAAEHHYDVVTDIAYNANPTDVSAAMLQLKQKSPDVVIFVSYASDAILNMKTMKQLGYKPQLVLVGVADVSVNVPEGGIVALLGSNGAGKATTLDAVAGLVRSSAGSIRRPGDSIEHLDAFSIVRRGLSLSPEGWRLFAQQTVAQNLLLGATALRDRKRIPELLEKVYTLFPNLAHRKKQLASTLSGGERQMLALGRALMSDPRMLLLDEPSLGLGPAIIEDLYETLLHLNDGGLTLLLAEQSVQLALEVADYAYVLQTARTVLEGPAEELSRSPQVQQIYLGLNGNAAGTA